MTAATRARERSGLSLEEAAIRARVSPGYLRRVEARGGASYPLARRLAAAYGCRIDAFLPVGRARSEGPAAAKGKRGALATMHEDSADERRSQTSGPPGCRKQPGGCERCTMDRVDAPL